MAGFLVNFTQHHDIIVQWDRHLFFKFRHVMASLSTSAKLLTVGTYFLSAGTYPCLDIRLKFDLFSIATGIQVTPAFLLAAMVIYATAV